MVTASAEIQKEFYMKPTETEVRLQLLVDPPLEFNTQKIRMPGIQKEISEFGFT